MTLLETERLVRKMTELLQRAGNPDLAPKLAGDFAAVCHACNLRLLQCEAMIKAGDQHQAIQLAETAPNLLDLVTLLEFRTSGEWRSFCQQNALPVADNIDARAVQNLNECYAHGIATDHPLYAAYRKAVLSRNDDGALIALQSIARLNPSDDNAASELERYDAKVLAAKLENLGQVLQGGDQNVVVAAMEAMESFGFKQRPDGDVWRKAELVRCSVLIEGAAKARKSGDWMTALDKLDFVQRLQKEFNLALPPQMVKEMEALEAWGRVEQEKASQERAFKKLLSDLHVAIQQSEEKDTSAHFVELPEMRDDFEALNKIWRALGEFTRPIPADATTAFRKRASLLENEINRRTRVSRSKILAGSAVALVVVTAAGWYLFAQIRVRELARELQGAVAERHVRATEKLLTRAQARGSGAENFGGLDSATGAASSFLTKERGLLANFESTFSQLPKELGGEPNAAELNKIAGQLAQVRTAFEPLAPDLKAEAEPRLTAFEKKWQQHISVGGAAVNGTLEQWVNKAEQQCAELDYRSSLETAATQLQALSNTLQGIADWEAGFSKHVGLRSDLTQRAAAVRTKHAAYLTEYTKIQDGLAALLKARSFAGYLAALNSVASSEYSGTPAVTAALAAQSLNATEETAARALLAVTNAGTWAFITRGTNTLFPEVVMPAERAFFEALFADLAVNGTHQLYRLWLDKDGSNKVDWITVGGFKKSQGWQQIKAFVPAADAKSASFVPMEYGYFDGQWRLSPKQVIVRLELVSPLNETAALSSVGLGHVWSGGSTYDGPLLEVLDTLKESNEGSAVFRAYLFCRLAELMELQPDAWGLTFCPAVRRDAREIRAIVGGNINSGDWFVSAKAQAWNAKLTQFFATHRSLSYAKQAAGLLALDRAAAKDGLRYVGFIGLDGKPVMTGTYPAAEIWGYDTARKSLVSSPGTAVPFSPLFALPYPRADYLQKFGVNPDEISFADALPTLFQSASKP